ncbi:MAG: hypothetical protein ABIH71_00055 [Candidatus Omnitrophota bacterium]
MKFKIWKGPSHFNKMFMFTWVIAGILGILLGLFLKDFEIVLIAVGMIIVGIVIYGFQMVAWKQWEEKQRKEGKEPIIFPTLHKFFNKKK